MSDFTPAVRRALLDAKCWKVRQGKGDHEIWRSPVTNTSFPVDSKIKSRHTANGVMKAAGLAKRL